MPPSEKLKELSLLRISERRLKGDVIAVYKCYHQQKYRHERVVSFSGERRNLSWKVNAAEYR